MTLIVRTLERRKLVSRRRSTEDGRRLVLQTTPRARALIQISTPESNAVYRDLEQAFGRDHMEGLLDALAEISAL